MGRGGQNENEWCLMEEALPGLGETKEESRLLPGPCPQACQGTGVETTRRCGVTAGAWMRAVDGLIARPSHPAKARASAVPPEVASVEGAGRLRGSPVRARLPRLQVRGQGGSQATAAPLAHSHPGNWQVHSHPS